MRRIAISFLISLYGCGTTVVGPVPVEKDTYSVTSRGQTGFAALSGIKAEAITQAMQYCASKGRDYQPLSTREVAAGFGVWPEAEVQFKCSERTR